MTQMEQYYEDGEVWEQEIYLSLRTSRNRAWMVSAILGGVAILCLIALIIVLPLKTVEPFVVTVDRNTGYTEVTRPLAEGTLQQDEAVIQFDLVRYLNARETYNPAVLEQNYKLAQSLSSGDAAKEHKALWDASNPDNPSAVYGRGATIDVRIKSVALLNERTASIRFQRELRQNNTQSVTHWNAILTFRHSTKPASMEERFLNPLGFEVTSYRLTQEIPEKE